MFLGSPTPETYRPLAGELTYRYFHPVRKQFWWQGANCHLASNALMLGWFSNYSGSQSKACVRLAYRQLEWIMGANPFGSCMMTGEGMRNPFPHSRFVGLIPGGIMNGIAEDLMKASGSPDVAVSASGTHSHAASSTRSPSSRRSRPGRSRPSARPRPSRCTSSRASSAPRSRPPAEPTTPPQEPTPSARPATTSGTHAMSFASSGRRCPVTSLSPPM